MAYRSMTLDPLNIGWNGTRVRVRHDDLRLTLTRLRRHALAVSQSSSPLAVIR